MTTVQGFFSTAASVSALLGLVLLGKCDRTPTSAPETARALESSRAVVVDQSVYRLQNGVAAIAVRFTNTSDKTAYLPHCGQVVDVQIERLYQDEWKRVGAWVCPAIAIPPDPVSPGASLVMPVRLFAGPSIAPEELTGTFRVRMFVYSSLGDLGLQTGPAWPADSTTSLSFKIER